LNHMRLVVFGNSGEADHFPVLQPKNMTNKIVLMQSLHNNNDATGFLVV
jgi:hypothetical protein